MLKKDVQQGRRRSKNREEVPTALRGAIRPFIFVNGKTPPALPPFENIIGTLRILAR